MTMTAPTVPHSVERSAPSTSLGMVLTRYSFIYVTCVLSLLGFAGSASHWLELTSHFRPHYAAVLLLGGLQLAWKREWWRLAPVFVCFLVSAWSIAPWYMPTATPPSQPALRILLANVLTTNTEYQRLLELVELEQPDVLVLLETDARWLEALTPLETIYPSQLTVPRGDNFGIAVLSKLPILDLHIVDYGANVPSIVGTLTFNDQPVQLIATHPLAPIGAEYSELRNEQLTAVAKSSSGPTIVIGDLNTTMWSPHHARFEADSGLHNVRRGFGILPTWPVGLGPLRIPLDHCLVSGDFQASDVRVGPSIGSDHLPLIVDLVSR